MRSIVTYLLFTLVSAPALAAETWIVRTENIVDEKAVVATVEPVHQLVARARIGGTVAALTIKEGDNVAAGAVIATVADEKLALQMQALDSRIACRSCSGAVFPRKPNSTSRAPISTSPSAI